MDWENNERLTVLCLECNSLSAGFTLSPRRVARRTGHDEPVTESEGHAAAAAPATQHGKPDGEQPPWTRPHFALKITCRLPARPRLTSARLSLTPVLVTCL